MDDQYLILDRRIRKDLTVLEEIWKELEVVDLEASGTEEKDIVFIGYRLHNLYSATENVFRNVAAAFGNQLSEKSGWHAELLDRMRLDLTPLRPAVIDDETFGQLDELRRFRHVFRGAYGIELDPERMALVLRKARALRRRLPAQLEAFLSFLETIGS